MSCAPRTCLLRSSSCNASTSGSARCSANCGQRATGAASRRSSGPSSTARRRHRSASAKRPGEPANLTRASGNVPGVPVRPALREVDLDAFFRPRSVAVIGASDTHATPTAAMTRKIKAWAEHFGATIHPVNPNRAEVYGIACRASVDEIDDDIDLAVILTGNAVEAFESVLDKKP